MAMTPSPLLTFAGAYRDPIVAGFLLGNGYRCYLPGLMRFNAPDSLSPFGRGRINPYVYCSDDPINRIDPSGHSDEAVITELVSQLLDRVVEQEGDRPLTVTQATEASAAASEAGPSSSTRQSRSRTDAQPAPATASGAHAHQPPAPLHDQRLIGRTLRAAKRPEPVQVRFATAAEKVESWEGKTYPQPGDAILTGGGNETWHVPIEDFRQRYSHEAGSPVAYPRGNPVTAVQMAEAFTAQPPWSTEPLFGKASDFLVTGGPGNAWPVDQERFFDTYDYEIVDD